MSIVQFNAQATSSVFDHSWTGVALTKAKSALKQDTTWIRIQYRVFDKTPNECSLSVYMSQSKLPEPQGPYFAEGGYSYQYKMG